MPLSFRRRRHHADFEGGGNNNQCYGYYFFIADTPFRRFTSAIDAADVFDAVAVDIAAAAAAAFSPLFCRRCANKSLAA